MQKRKVKKEQLCEDSRDLNINNRSTKKKKKKNIATFRNNDSLNGTKRRVDNIIPKIHKLTQTKKNQVLKSP